MSRLWRYTWYPSMSSRRRRDPRVQVAAAQLIEPGADEQPPARIPLLPADTRAASRDGRQHIVRDAAAVVAESIRRAPSDGLLPIDTDHAAFFGLPGQGAAGWLSDLRVEADGGISAAADWTQLGADALTQRRYRYVSAEYRFRDGPGGGVEIASLVGASLVLRPAFDMPAIAAEGGEMDIRELLGLGPEASDEEVATAAAAWRGDREVAVAARKALSLEEGADAEAIRTAAAAASSGGTDSDPDPAQYVPRAQYDELAQRVSGLESQRSSESAERAVAAAVEEGAIAPSQREWALKYASSDLPGFQAYAKAAPRIFGPGTPAAEAAAAAAAGGDEAVRTSAEREVLAKLGVSEDAYTASAAEIDGRAGGGS